MRTAPRTYKPPEMTRRIIKRRLARATVRQIAAEEEISKNTVVRILSLPEVREEMARARSKIISAAQPIADRLVNIVLGKKKGDWRGPLETLKGVGVLKDYQEAEHYSKDGENPFVVIFVAIHKRPPRDEQELSEFRRTLALPPATLKDE